MSKSQTEKEPIFIGVAWPYVNGYIHIGHVAGYLLPADITARFYRLRGHDVLMASGSDCHGTPITIEADKENVEPENIVQKYHEEIVTLFDNLDLSFDIYTKTTTKNHEKTVQDVLSAFWDKGLISIKEQKQYYSPESERFLPDRYVIGKCPFCGYEKSRSDQCEECGKLLDQNLIEPKTKLGGKPVELKKTTHAYIEWNKLQPKIKKYVQEYKSGWKEWVVKETENWLKEGLQPRPVTRDLNWGIPLPEKIAKHIPNSESKRIYVWFDAVTGYLSASLEWAQNTNNDWRYFWYNQNSKHYYFMGKDNLVFHTIFWPGQLTVYDENLKLPDVPAINQYLTFEGGKFSKSEGRGVTTADFIAEYGTDPLRFYLTTIMPENSDSSFYWDDFIQKNNSILVGHIGNYIHRTLTLYEKVDFEKQLSKKVVDECEETYSKVIKHLENCEFKKYWECVDQLAKFANQQFDTRQPWVTKKEKATQFKNDGGDLIGLAYAIMLLLIPVMPQSCGYFFEMIGLKPVQTWPEQGELTKRIESNLKKATSVAPQPLFKKFDPV